MKKIKTISLTSLRVEEDFGFQKLILAETANLPGQGEDEPGLPEVQSARTANPVLANAITTFTDAFNAFDAALKTSDSNPSTATAANADAARDSAWRATNAYVKAMCNHPTADIAAVAIEAKEPKPCSTSTATLHRWRRPRKAASCTTSCKTSTPFPKKSVPPSASMSGQLIYSRKKMLSLPPSPNARRRKPPAKWAS